MDPNETLIQLRDLVFKADTEGLDEVDTARMIELFDALDKWIANGGFLPTYWQN